jgi:hypothetical protein
VAVGQRPHDAGRDVVDVGRVDEHGGATGDLLGGRAPRRHHRRAVRHRLGHRKAEAFAQAGVDKGVGTRIQRVPVSVGDEAEQTHPVARRRRGAPPPLQPDDSEDVIRLEPLHGGHEPGQVLARLERADEQEVAPFEAVAAAHRHHRGGVDGGARHAEGNMAKALGPYAGGDAVAHRRLRGSEHEVGVAPDQIEAALENAPAPAREVGRLVQEREVVDRDDERRRTGRHDDRGGVDHVDGPGGPFDRRRPQPQP